MTAFSERHVGNWTFRVGDAVFPLPADLTQRVKQPVANRSDRRRAERDVQRKLRHRTNTAATTTITVTAAPPATDLIGDVTNWQPTGVQQ